MQSGSRRSSPFGGLPVRGQDPNVAAALLRYAELLRAAEEWRLAAGARDGGRGGSRVPVTGHPSRLARLVRAFTALRRLVRRFVVGRATRAACGRSMRSSVPEHEPE